LKTTNEINSELTNDTRTLEKRKEVKEKLKQLGETDDVSERILSSIEAYCQLILQTINKCEYGSTE
jgi:ribonucleotide monophosphatase NagD (HAD superfamily)